MSLSNAPTGEVGSKSPPKRPHFLDRETVIRRIEGDDLCLKPEPAGSFHVTDRGDAGRMRVGDRFVIAVSDTTLARRMYGVKKAASSAEQPHHVDSTDDLVLLCHCEGTIRDVAWCLGSNNAAVLYGGGWPPGDTLKLQSLDDPLFGHLVFAVQKRCGFAAKAALNTMLGDG